MDIHRVAYRITFNYFRGSEIPLHEFDLYVRLVTGLLKSIPYEEVIEGITGEVYKGQKIQDVRKEIAEAIINTVNYKMTNGMMRIDLKDINDTYTKTEYESGFLHGILGKKFVSIGDNFLTLEEYDLHIESMKLITKLSKVTIEGVQLIKELKEKFKEYSTWFNMYSEKQIDTFFILLDEDIRRGRTKKDLSKLMTERTIYGRINRDWVDYHKSTQNFEYKLESIMDFTFKLNKLTKSERQLYSEWGTLSELIKQTGYTLEELQKQGYLQHIKEEDLHAFI